MESVQLVASDEYGLLIKIPYIAIELTLEQWKEIENRQPVFYELNGKKLFDIKNETGELSSKKMIFIAFK